MQVIHMTPHRQWAPGALTGAWPPSHSSLGDSKRGG